MGSREARVGREAKRNGGQALGPEKKPEEVGPFPLDLGIVHVTGEAVIVNLGSSNHCAGWPG